MGDMQPPAAHYRVETGDNSFYAEFLTPLEGSAVKRGGRRDVTARVSGVSVQKLRYLELLLQNPWEVMIAPAVGYPTPDVRRIPSSQPSVVPRTEDIEQCRALGTKRITQYAHTAWRLQDGSFVGQPQAITQTADGYLWVGTQNGLMRFDGVRFATDAISHADPTLYLNVISLLGASDGSLWIGTSRGLAHLSNGNLFRYSDGPGRVNAIVQDRYGTIWYARSRFHGPGPLCRVDGNSVRCFGRDAGIESPYASTLNRGLSDSLWIGQGDALAHWVPKATANYRVPGLAKAEGFEGIGAILDEPDGSLLVGFLRAGAGLGLERFSEGHWTPLRVDGMATDSLNVSALCRDHDGALWIGTESDGLYRLTDGRLDHYGAANGLSNDSINSIMEDKEGNIWVATTAGIDRFHDLPVSQFTVAEGVNGNTVESVLATKDGMTWFGTFGALQSIDENDTIRSIRGKDGLPGQRVTILFEDHSGALWVGTDDRLSRYRGGRFEPVKFQDGRDLGILYGLAEDKEGDIWAIAHHDSNSLVRIRSLRAEDVSKQFPDPVSITEVPDGTVVGSFVDGTVGSIDGDQLKMRVSLASLHLTSNRLFALKAMNDGSLWGVTADGLVGIKDSVPKLFNMKQGLPCLQVFSAVPSGDGDLWLNAACGLIEIPKKQLDASWTDSSYRLNPILFGVSDGVESGPSTFDPNSTRDLFGRLWFANGTTLQSITPGKITHNTHAPPVYIETLIADHRGYSHIDYEVLPANTRDVEIDYTALSLVDPRKVQFRYKLIGQRLDRIDTEWQSAGTRRQAFYTNLPPGRYKFRVIACNNNGVWNDVGASIDFLIPPAWYQTIWFRSLCVCLSLVLLWMLYQLRLRQLERQFQLTSEARVGERERIARDLHDTFFQGIQGLLLRFNTATFALPKDEPARQILEETLRQSDQVMLEGRQLVLDLRAMMPQQCDLRAALVEYGERMRKDRGCAFELTVTGNICPLQPVACEETLNIGKEALGNAFRHSGGQSIEAELNYEPNEFRMRIRDDGAGIDPKILKQGSREGHWGLPGMRERAEKIGAHLEIWSGTGIGTEIELRVAADVAYIPETRRLLSVRLRSLWTRRKEGNGKPGVGETRNGDRT
jgi:signal transduction histidine kinase/ligand-binding sensor domain-containing protein